MQVELAFTSGHHTPSLSNRKDTLQITWCFLICQILDTQSSLFCYGYALVGCTIVCPFAVKSSRPRRGGAKRQGGTSREGRKVLPCVFVDGVSVLNATYLSQSLADSPVEIHPA